VSRDAGDWPIGQALDVTDDQQFILALAAVVSTTVIQVMTYRKASSTHELVNGISVKRTRQARASGRKAGVAAEVAAERKRNPVD
jgi:hypothetical protein